MVSYHLIINIKKKLHFFWSLVIVIVIILFGPHFSEFSEFSSKNFRSTFCPFEMCTVWFFFWNWGYCTVGDSKGRKLIGRVKYLYDNIYTSILNDNQFLSLNLLDCMSFYPKFSVSLHISLWWNLMKLRI